MSVAPQGAAVLRMLSDFLTEPVFVQGLNVCLYCRCLIYTICAFLFELFGVKQLVEMIYSTVFSIIQPQGKSNSGQYVEIHSVFFFLWSSELPQSLCLHKHSRE